MARLPRLALPGFAHYVIQRGHNGENVFADNADREAYLGALAAAAAAEPVQLHAWALLDAEVQLLATPATAVALSRFMQGVNRRYVRVFNRRHGRTGTLWDGRFRCAVVEPGPLRLQALVLIDGAGGAAAAAVGAAGAGAGADADAAARATTAGPRLGGLRDGLLIDPPEYWQLGNTPFEREAAYGRLLAAGLPPATAAVLRRAALGGWAAGLPGVGSRLAEDGSRPLAPRRRGRPRLSRA